MAHFTRAELESFKDASVPDLIGPGVKLLFVGVNPGLWTAAVQTPFAHPSNRFWPALAAAGIIDGVDPSDGMTDADRKRFVARGLGLTNLVQRATVRADELSAEELRAGAKVVTAFIEEWRPRVVAIAGVTSYRVAFEDRKAKMGLQPDSIGGAEVHVVPNPSGLNAHYQVADLAEIFRGVAVRAGIL